MTTFLSQLPALIGVIVGAFGTLLTTRLNDRAQWTRALSVRWDERRLDAYSEYARALKEVHLLAHRITAPSRPSSRAHPIDRTTGLELLAEADAQRTKAWEGVLLLGDADTVAAAREWRWAVLQLERAARDLAEPDFDWVAAVRRADDGRDRFYTAARAGLTVGSDDVAQSRWLADRQLN
ncbi:hypothetical protein AR457_38755 [Streptomyces agglomeratus]|uniref:Secreted protein n=1 Tax=Streptomyces agglomeratus TaxID=285458 RepID=A0A1E5PHU4_9ACTN|nr:hypothetical protein [Streptomyces agglomeratus]OEJ20986.1 hypothetical protein AS594_40090 [Streptomyces agglomeratus]OEJ21889.1 hypothetical protein AR457_38755 [Streptomyces agglomeratus]OEJ29109.1 hypothetical protein AS594_36615 [Streptomyces agglomeratus]OEJ49555.1 hypothetical protein BGK72_00720 [Streptomyces agglomeratus]OEJ56777.1 hypothetical protein BGM19_00620 [Streptomyces agglomeratus]